MIHASLAAVCFAACVFFAIVCESLRNFFRSRLASLCRRKGNEARFGLILRDDETALQMASFGKQATLAMALLLAGYARYGSGTAPGVWQLVADLLIAIFCCWWGIWVIPWSISRVAAESVLFRGWPLIGVLLTLFSPLQKIVRRFDTLMHRLAGRSDPTPESLETFAEEIQSVVDEGEREGILESHAGRMIQRVMELREADVRSVMTPRTDIVAIQASCTLEEARKELIEAGHSRIPVVDGNMDGIIGILYARDLLETFGTEAAGKTLRDIVRPPFYVPETTTINTLLDRMKEQRLHLAIVLDEYGGVTGLVTLEDILEEIVGDITDEFDESPEELYQMPDRHTLIVDARMHLDELNQLFELNFPDDRDFDTIGGFIFSELGRIPRVGEVVNWERLRITVLEATERKVVRLEIFSEVPWPDVSPQPRGDSKGAPSQVRSAEAK